MQQLAENEFSVNADDEGMRMHLQSQWNPLECHWMRPYMYKWHAVLVLMCFWHLHQCIVPPSTCCPAFQLLHFVFIYFVLGYSALSSTVWKCMSHGSPPKEGSSHLVTYPFLARGNLDYGCTALQIKTDAVESQNTAIFANPVAKRAFCVKEETVHKSGKCMLQNCYPLLACSQFCKMRMVIQTLCSSVARC